MSSKNIHFFVLIALISFVPNAYAVGKSAKIIMIGDSITQGGNLMKEYSYRYELFKILLDENTCFEFIGTEKKPQRANFSWPLYRNVEFQKAHQSYYGIKTQELYERLKPIKAIFTQADIALIHIGTNDQNTTMLKSNFETPLRNIIRLLHSQNENILIFISSLNQNYGRVVELRRNIQNVVSWASSNGFSIKIVEHNKTWIERPSRSDSDTFDWVHPNPKGQKKMAIAWHDKMKEFYDFQYTCE